MLSNVVNDVNVSHIADAHIRQSITESLSEYNCIFLTLCHYCHDQVDKGRGHCYHISLAIRRSIFSFRNHPINLDLSYKMDLDLWELFNYQLADNKIFVCKF